MRPGIQGQSPGPLRAPSRMVPKPGQIMASANVRSQPCPWGIARKVTRMCPEKPGGQAGGHVREKEPRDTLQAQLIAGVTPRVSSFL